MPLAGAGYLGRFLLTERPGSTQIRSAPDVPEPEMVRDAAWTFQMGAVRGELGREGDETPRHTIHIDAPFQVSKYEITEAL